MDTLYHYPPELLALLIDAIPRLCKSKQDVLTFFMGAGVDRELLKPFVDLLRDNREGFNKFKVTREVLTQLNDRGEPALGARRAIIKRVTETDDFSGCWETDRAAARGLVAQVRDLVNVKDSFTRINLEREGERKQRLAERMTVQKTIDARREKIASVRRDLYALFPLADAHKRGKTLERVLNELFKAYGVAVREAFEVKGPQAEGIVEQIDGVIEIDGQLYLVEMKWWNSPIGVAEVSPHLVRVFNRGGQVRGIFISYSAFTEAAIIACRDAQTQGKTVVLVLLEEIVQLLDSDKDLKDMLKAKVTTMLTEKKPFARA